MDRRKLIRAALMQELPELVLKNAKVVNVLTGEIVDGDIAITDGHIAGVGSYCGKTELDLCGKYVTPGFINAHVHVESSMVTPEVYAMEELRHGTTTIITDPHEIANVAAFCIAHLTDAVSIFDNSHIPWIHKMIHNLFTV